MNCNSPHHNNINLISVSEEKWITNYNLKNINTLLMCRAPWIVFVYATIKKFGVT